ncbi:MAG TPA: ABC transporter permease [Saprospiraceae bacterium]|nr:ABC transporter permease [Saprospiraceae bacterium]
MRNSLTLYVQRITGYVLILFVFTAFLHKFIANDLPLVGKLNDQLVFPVLQDYSYSIGLRKIDPRVNINDIEPVIPAFISFSPIQMDSRNTVVPPGKAGHWLGTDHLGRDVAAGLISGFWIALQVGVFSIALAFVIALFMGGSAAYFRKFPLYLNTIQIFGGCMVLLIGGFYLVNEWNQIGIGIRLFYFSATLLVTYAVIRWAGRFKLRKYNTQLSLVVNKLIEVRESIPSLFLVLGLVVLFERSSVWNVVIIIGLIGWSNLARYIRAEMMSVMEENYIKAVLISGISRWRILVHHILPNALDSVIALVAFSIASAILLEASLSFLGIGIPIEQPTWGSLLSAARRTNAWWLAVFPGFCIFMIVTSLNIWAGRIQNFLDPRLRS